MDMEMPDIHRRYAIPVRVANQLLSPDPAERLAGLRRLQEDVMALDLFWTFASLLPELEQQPWEPGKEEELEPLRRIAEGMKRLPNLRHDSDKRISRRASELCDLIETWELIDKGEIEPPFLTKAFVPVRVSSLAGLALVRRRNWFVRYYMRIFGL